MAKIVTVEGAAVEAVVLDDGEKLKQFTLNPRTATSWEANLLTEVVKISSGAWPTDQYDKRGQQMFVMQDPKVVVARAAYIVGLTVQAMRDNKWSVGLPTASELIEEDGGRAGFVVRNPNGKTDTGSPPLPAKERPAQAHRRPGDPGDQS